jgi:cyclopropane-fatty-acyl-phospholipid synthase
MRGRRDEENSGAEMRANPATAGSEDPSRARGWNLPSFDCQNRSSTEFYELFLARDLVHSCAYFTTLGNDLELAQRQMLDYISRKLRLCGGERILEIRCGWGAWTLYAARRHRIRAFATTSSTTQAEFVRNQLRLTGIADRCIIEVASHRNLDPPAEFDRIVSLEMSEALNEPQMAQYFQQLFSFLTFGGVFLRNVIVSPSLGQDARDFVPHRQLVRDPERLSLPSILRMAEQAGLEVRDIECLREHYALTLEHWLENLDCNAKQARDIAGEEAYRTWHLNLASAVHAFRCNNLSAYQLLFSKPKRGASGFPLRRADWYQ